jgi:hypothetical protein
MSFLQKAKGEMAYLKAGLYGEAGSGKTFTSCRVALGLSDFIKGQRPIAFVDTETGSDFTQPLFRSRNKELVVAKTKAFADLLQIVDEAEKDCDILIIDSITHFWNELIDAYMKKNELKRLSLKHWMPLKATWREFTDKFVMSKLHIIVCGRSADKWEEVEDPEDGAKELRKVGTKMKAEREMSYEPSLLIEMEAIQKTAHAGGQYVHRAYVQKDRFDVINGKQFDDPGFEQFLPHIELLNIGGDHRALEPGRDSTAMFTRNDIGERKSIQKDILLEKLQNEIKKLYPGQTKEDTLAKIALLEELFGTNSWTQLEKFFDNDKLAEGLNNLQLRSLKVAAEVAKAEPVATPAPTNGKSKTKGAHA